MTISLLETISTGKYDGGQTQPVTFPVLPSYNLERTLLTTTAVTEKKKQQSSAAVFGNQEIL